MSPPNQRPTKTYGKWTDCGALGDAAHIRSVVDVTGRRAVLKKPRRNSRISLARFEEEASGMAALSEAGQMSIMPVLDVDRSDPPRWFVMPEAKMLSDSLGLSPDLSRVVEAIEHVASTLVALAEQRIAHRDLKPPNLFWLDGEAVIGDLGIATWPQRSDLTALGKKVGAMYFLAPEARRHEDGTDYFRSDVWSLAKCLFVLARPERGPYPPDGTHYPIGREFSLWAVGREAGLALSPVLEAATQFQPGFRLPMAEFRDELRDWLQLYPVGTVERPAFPGFGRGWRAVDGELEQVRRRGQAMRSALDAEMRALAKQYLSDDRLWTRDGSEMEPPASVLVHHEFPQNSEDGFEPDASYFAATTVVDSRCRRFVLWAALEHGTVTMFAEVQRVTGSAVTLERYWWHEASVLLPSCQARLAEIHDDIVRWTERSVMDTAADPVSNANRGRTYSPADAWQGAHRP